MIGMNRVQKLADYDKPFFWLISKEKTLGQTTITLEWFPRQGQELYKLNSTTKGLILFSVKSKSHKRQMSLSFSVNLGILCNACTQLHFLMPQQRYIVV